MCPASLFRIGHLALQDGLELLLAHAGPGQDAFALGSERGADDDDGVAARLALRFEQERDVEHGQSDAGRSKLLQEARLGGTHQRVHERLEMPDGRLSSAPVRQEVAVDGAVSHRSGRYLLDQRHRLAMRAA